MTEGIAVGWYDELVGSFKVKDGLKINSQIYWHFLGNANVKWVTKNLQQLKAMIFMQDNDPSYTVHQGTPLPLLG